MLDLFDYKVLDLLDCNRHNKAPFSWNKCLQIENSRAFLKVQYNVNYSENYNEPGNKAIFSIVN